MLVGFMAAAWLFTLLSVAYVMWRYVYSPWKVLRADIASLHSQIQGIQSELRLRRAMYLGDEERLARLESRAAVRRLLEGTAGNHP